MHRVVWWVLLWLESASQHSKTNLKPSQRTMNDDGVDSENFTLKKDLGTPLILHCSEIRKRLKIAMDVVPVLCAFLACIDHIGFSLKKVENFLLVHIY